MKLVLLSDIHFKLGSIPDIYINDYEGIYYPTQNLLLAAEIAKIEKADAIFILGDVFDRTSNSHFLVDCIGRIFEVIKGVCPVFI
ncbi:MAG: metallophosphoesterase, partial [Elusimicrobiales bacterium]|nr:metallophosphoesterase [Elusimicrobiales bacterium]